MDCITDFIFMEDELEKSDVILIPGGSHSQLIERAVELYHKGLAPYILPSGGPNPKLQDYESEWEFLYDYAINHGVPAKAILREDKASHTFENAEFSLQVLKDKGLEVKKAIMVCKNFHSRRAYLTYKTAFPATVKLIVTPIVDGNNIERDNWFLNEKKISRVMGEVMKIGQYFEKHVPSWVEKL